MKLKSLIVVLLCIVVCSSCEQPPIEAYAVLPQPQEINYVQGFVKLKDKPMVVYSNELSNEALLLASYLKNDFAVEVTLEEGKDKGDVILLLDSTVLPDKKGGYVLEAAGSRITIKASTPEGVFNGVQTLRQIIKEREDQADSLYSYDKSKVNSFSVFNRLLLYCICISFALQGIYKILQLEHTKNPAKIKNKMDSCFRRTEYLDIEQ